MNKKLQIRCAGLRNGLPRRALWELALLLGLLLALALTAGQARFARVSAQVRGDTLRLHIVANSDSQADQDLKLLVRDGVVAQAGALFGSAQSQADALAQAEQSLPLLAQAARQVVRQQGSLQGVTVRLVRMYFPTTVYQDFTLPAGMYDAVRVELGEAKGHNWFCVLYPALCLPAAEGAAYPDPAETALVCGDYQLRFAALEWAQALWPD